LMASKERRSTLHMPLWVQSVGEKIIQETLLQHFELIKEYAKLDPSLKLWRVSRYWQADYKYFSKQNVSHVGTLLIPNHETRQQLFPRLAWFVCPSVTWQFYVLIHRLARHVNIKNYLFSVSWRSDPLICEADSATPLCVRPSGRICFFFFFFWIFFVGFFSPSLKLTKMKKQKI
jgi:hypothetical protein